MKGSLQMLYSIAYCLGMFYIVYGGLLVGFLVLPLEWLSACLRSVHSDDPTVSMNSGNTRRCPGGGQLLGQRRRRWHNIGLTS